jgi:uncharacterized membrane protein
LPGENGSWSPIDALSFAWQAMMKDFGAIALPLALAYLVYMIASGAISGALAAIQAGIEIALGLGSRATFDFAPGRPLYAQIVDNFSWLDAPFSFIGVLLQGVPSAFIFGGTTRFSLKVARGQRPELLDVFSGATTMGPLYVAYLLSTLGIWLGFFACIVPGILLFLAWSMYIPLVVDRQLGAVAALRKSVKLTKGHRMSLFFYFVLAFIVVMLGCLACCVGTVVVALPMTSIALAYVYLKLSGESPRLPL